MRVVHCKREPYTHYIGRPSVFGNPFVLERECERDDILTYYNIYARRQGEVLDAIMALPEDAVLGCWCWPKPCHGEIIMEIWRELHA
jgi:hypothetical protein